MNCSDGIRRSRKGERMARSEPKVAQPSEVGEARERDLRPAGRSVSFTEAFRFWVKLGFISFGGPAGQIAIMHRELVERRRWLSEERFLHALNYCMLLPGPEAQQLAITSAGYCTGRRAALSPGPSLSSLLSSSCSRSLIPMPRMAI